MAADRSHPDFLFRPAGPVMDGSVPGFGPPPPRRPAAILTRAPVAVVISVNLCCKSKQTAAEVGEPKAVVTGERRVSLPSMGAGASPSLPARVVIVAVAVAGLLSACGEAGDDARVAADRALEQVDALEARVSDLEGALEAATEGLDRARAFEGRISKGLDALGDRLERSMARIKENLSDVRTSASEEAASALAQAQQVARDLEILEQRYDYHLRRYHGGG
jgi:hypothetical protein